MLYKGTVLKGFIESKRFQSILQPQRGNLIHLSASAVWYIENMIPNITCVGVTVVRARRQYTPPDPPVRRMDLDLPLPLDGLVARLRLVSTQDLYAIELNMLEVIRSVYRAIPPEAVALDQDFAVSFFEGLETLLVTQYVVAISRTEGCAEVEPGVVSESLSFLKQLAHQPYEGHAPELNLMIVPPNAQMPPAAQQAAPNRLSVGHKFLASKKTASLFRGHRTALICDLKGTPQEVTVLEPYPDVVPVRAEQSLYVFPYEY